MTSALTRARALEIEIIRLRADHVAMMDKAAATTVELRAEIERLRAALEDISHATDSVWMADLARRALAGE